MKKVLNFLYVISLLYLLFCCQLLPVTGYAAANTETTHRVVRVGLFPFEGYYQLDKQGHRTGYGYDLLQQMAQHTNWTYEYVDNIKTWDELQEMLADGRLDMLTSTQKTPENLLRFAFSSTPISTSSTLFTVRAGNETFSAGNPATYNGTRIGMMRTSSHNQKFARFAAAKGFTYQPVYFDSLPELLQALQEGTVIDAAVTSSLRPLHNEWIMEQFDPSPFFMMFRKDDTSLQTETDYALAQMDICSPNWRSELFHKYYAPDNGANLLLSAEERQYVTQL